jgi:alpha-beta hydrolase superfamily lysophospholipase
MTDLPITRSYQDAEGVESIFFEWPAAKPRGVVQLAHGLGEHARRYDELAAFLNREGFSVYADDHRGHGDTGLKQLEARQIKTLGNLGPGGMNATFEAVHELTKLVRRENPGVPLILLGHSWGSFIAQKLLNRYSRDYDLAILTGTTLTMPGTMGAFGFNKKWNGPGATGFEWLSRDPEVAKAFVADPKTFYADAAKVFGISNSLKLFGKPSADVRDDLPMLVMVGSDDPIGAEKGAKALVDAYQKRSGVRDIELVVYHDARHEVFNETNRQEVFVDLADWLAAHLPE